MGAHLRAHIRLGTRSGDADHFFSSHAIFVDCTCVIWCAHFTVTSSFLFVSLNNSDNNASMGTVELSMCISGIVVIPLLYGNFPRLEAVEIEKHTASKIDASLLNFLLIPPVTALVSLWLSSAVLMLDWERSWQVCWCRIMLVVAQSHPFQLQLWPVPSVFGVIFGEAIGTVVASLCLLVERIKSD